MRTRMQKLRVALLAASTLGAAVLFYAANPAHADVDSVAGSAFGAAITSSLLGTVLAPAPPGISGMATAPTDGSGPVAGRHRQLDRQVAIKQLPRSFSEYPEVRRRFSSEAKILASLDHPHIVPIFDYVEHGGLCVLVMEMLPGGTVREWHAAGLSSQAARALSRALGKVLRHT